MIKSKKHWLSYFWSLFFMVLFGFPALNSYLYGSELENFIPVFKHIFLIFAIWVFYKNIMRIIFDSRIEWIFEDNTLILKSGLFSWEKTNYEIDISQIFEIYYSQSFLGSILGFGSLHVIKTDGISSAVVGYNMTNHKKMTSAINNAIISYKKRLIPSVNNVKQTVSIADEISKLSDLNKMGIITDVEFKNTKDKILNNF